LKPDKFSPRGWKWFVVAVFMLLALWAPHAHANPDAGFDDYHLVIVVYDPNSDEKLMDLGLLIQDSSYSNSIDLTQQNKTILPAGSFSLGDFSAVDEWSTLNAAFYCYFTPQNLSWFATTSKSAPQVLATQQDQFMAQANSIAVDYEEKYPGSKAVKGSAYADNSYYRRMDQLGLAPGAFAGFNQDVKNGEANLAPLDAGQSVNLYLYQFENDTLVKGAQADYIASLRINPDGSVTLNPSVANSPPTADAGVDQTRDEGATVTLSGTASDPDGAGDIASYAWTQTGGTPTVTIDNAGSLSASFTAPQVDAAATLEFTLTVTDKKGASASDTVTVTVNNVAPVNHAPIIQSATADPAQVTEAGVAALAGSASDEEGDTLTYTWAQTAPATPQGAITDADHGDAAATYTAPAVSAQTMVTLTLTVDDGKGGTATRDVTLTVTPNQAPVAVARATPATIDIGEIQSVTLDGSGSSDAEGGAGLTFQWQQTGGSFTAGIADPSAAVTSFSVPADAAAGTLTFTLTVTDSGGKTRTAECTVQLQEAGGNQPPTAEAGPAQTVYEAQPVTLDGTASTDPDGDTLTYTWEQISGPVSVELSPAGQGMVQFTAPQVDQASMDLVFKLTVADTGFQQTDTVTVTVLNNQLPNAPQSALINLPGQEYAESPTAAPVLTVSNAEDPDGDVLTYDFEIYSDESLSQASLMGEATDVVQGPAATSWTAPELAENTMYYWRVRAYDGKENGPWMDTGRLFINAVDEPPTVPGISAPADGTTVATLQPVLEITNSTDPDQDPLAYEFRVYANPDDPVDQFLVEKTGVLEGTSGATQWTVDTELEEDQTYWWRARARDDTDLISPWTEAVSFSVNSQDVAPTAVTILSPQDQAQVTTSELTVSIENSTDADGDAIVYFFELDTVNTFDSPEKIVSDEIPEDPAGTSWTVPGTLTENTQYYLRAKAGDAGGAQSSWTVISFTMNQFSEPPNTPTLLYPEDSARVTTLSPRLQITPADPPDADNDPVSYDFEVYLHSDRTEPIASVSGWQELQWTVPSGVLLTGEKYAWRVRGVDAHDAGAWTPFYTFITNGNNYQPATPLILSPYGGGTVDTQTPELAVIAAPDGDGAASWVEFELYGNSDLTDYIDFASLPQGDKTTTWQVKTPLADGESYYWRTRATDGEKFSSWSPVSSFTVDLSGSSPAPQIRVWKVKDYYPVWADTVQVDETDSPIYGAAVVLPENALQDNLTVYIGEAVSGVPAMGRGQTPLGRVFEFGPSGTVFDQPVTLRLPYSQADLDAAGVLPEDLAVMTYDTASGKWKSVTGATVDPDTKVVECQVGHFSLYAIASSSGTVSPPAANDGSSGGGGGGGGGCFILSIQDW
jgi:K319L-like, PKD domain/Bacterial Ig domain/ZU5 domain